jgi:hypothetical protein
VFRKRRRSTSVRELRNQEAQHDSGIILRSAGRENVQLEYGGRTLTLGIDRGVGADLFYLPAVFTWDDGTPVSPEVVALIRPAITEINEFWGSTAEFRTLGG